MSIEKYIQEYSNQPKSKIGWIAQSRNSAIQQFEENGFPSLQQEDWRETNVAPIMEKYFSSVDKALSNLSSFDGFWTSSPHVVFYNGKIVKNKIDIDGIEIKDFQEALETNEKKYRSIFELAPKSNHPFFDLNTSLVKHGTAIEVKRNAKVKEPIYLVYISDSKQQAHYYRNLISLDVFAEAKIVEVYITANSTDNSLVIPVTQIQVAEGSILDHVKYQNQNDHSFHTGITLADLRGSGQVRTYSFSFGSALTRNDIQIGLQSEGAECVVDGLYVVSDMQIVDHHTVVDHAKPHCSSSETYKGVLLGKSQAIFEGKVIVDIGAQKTDARQLNQNLMLSNEAKINTAPQLEIRAHDVKCTHGATIGKLDPNQIFYLQSRGIDLKSAQRILITAYAGEVISKIGIPELEFVLSETLEKKIAL